MCEFSHKWRNLPIVLTNHAYDKSADIQLSLWDIQQILEYSEDCLENKREINKFERCTKWRKKDIKIVFKKEYSQWTDKISWIIITIIERR